MMSPGGSIVASLENVNGFLAMNVPLDDLIRIDFEQEGVVLKVMLHIFKEFVLLLGRHSLNNEIPRMEENPPEQSRLGIFFSKEIFEGRLIRIHNAFVHDEVYGGYLSQYDRKTMEVFMDDFSVFGNSFETCLSHLEKMLKQCKDTNLCMNWEKSHFMVKEGIVLGHKISKNEIEVDKAKVDVIAKLPDPTTVKGIHSFLGHASFYRRFIHDFSKIARLMTRLLEKDTPFFFSKECVKAF
nr:reverse transcriptase domain-containing protein [Tanacetum cinerariifolium]